jgi:long-chain acyl-CoA synthetase
MLWDFSRIYARSDVVVPGDTLAQMFWNAIELRADTVALRQKDRGIWKSVSWRELGTAARETGLGLAALGFEPGQCASILANTVEEWLYADYGILGAGGVSNGIYPTDAPAQVEFLLRDSGSVYLFVDDEEQLDKALEVRERLPLLKRVIVFNTEGLRNFHDPLVMSLAELRELGRDYHTAHPHAWEERLHSRRAHDLAVLIYTSGTTGNPKGAMLSHHNILHALRGYNLCIAQDEHDERMCFLPLCHVAERLGGAYFALYTGAKLNFVENPDTVPENVREIAPTVLIAVPRVWEKFYSAIQIAIAEATPLERWAYAVAIALGYRVAERVVAGKPVSAQLKFAWWLGRVCVLGNVRRLIGIDRCRFLVTGAAPISPDLVRWYLALGVPMLEVWGQTENGGAATVMPVTGIRPGSIGVAGPFNEVRVSPQGELLIRGDNVFMGYLNQPEKTAETLKDGWLHTGDVGSVDEHGYFKITDRMKDIIITAGGKNVTPSEIENQLKFSPYITDAVVIGDKRPFLTALVMIDQENVEKHAQDHDIPFSNYASLCRATEIQDLIQGEITRVNEQFSRAEQVKKFRLLEKKLGAEDEEMTPTMKLKRKLVNQKYQQLIDSMYA